MSAKEKFLSNRQSISNLTTALGVTDIAISVFFSSALDAIADLAVLSWVAMLALDIALIVYGRKVGCSPIGKNRYGALRNRISLLLILRSILLLITIPTSVGHSIMNIKCAGIFNTGCSDGYNMFAMVAAITINVIRIAVLLCCAIKIRKVTRKTSV